MAVETRIAGRELEAFPMSRGGAPDLIEGLIPRNSSVLFYGKPKTLKSWLALALTVRASVPGTILGMLKVRQPVRTLLLALEDAPLIVQSRMHWLFLNQRFDASRFRILTADEVPKLPGLNLRNFHLPNPVWFDLLVKFAHELQADHIILDSTRAIAKRLDLNKASDTADFIGCLEELQDATGATVTLCHAENKNAGPAGSMNLAGWAKVVGHLGQRREEKRRRRVTVELDTDSAWRNSLEPMRVILDVQASDPLRLETL